MATESLVRFVGGDVSPLFLLCLMDMCRAISGVPGAGVLLWRVAVSSSDVVIGVENTSVCVVLSPANQ